MALTLCLSATCAAENDFRNQLKSAADLCKSGKHAESVAAYTALANERANVEDKFEALSAAAKCTRLHLRSEEKALAVCDLLEDETYRLGCRAVVYQWASSPSKVLEDLGDVDLLLWPEKIAATAFMVRAQAHYREKHGKEAVNDFVRAYQLSGGRPKWSAIQRLGDTFQHLMDDEILAEACYRKAIKTGGMGWPGLQARVSLGDLLIKQQRYDDALQIFNVKPGGSWRVAMLLGSARVYRAMGKRDKAKTVIEEALKSKGIHAHQRKNAEKMLSELEKEAQ